MKETICLLLVCSIFLTGCAGRDAYPIAAYLPGDERRSCESLRGEISQLQADMAALLPKTDKGVSNALWATAGVFLIVPFFFMDLKDAEKIEFEAMRRRYNRLISIAAEKDCDMGEIRVEKRLIFEEQKAKEMARLRKQNEEAKKRLAELQAEKEK